VEFLTSASNVASVTATVAMGYLLRNIAGILDAQTRYWGW
jgi:hypothetical protein